MPLVMFNSSITVRCNSLPGYSLSILMCLSRGFVCVACISTLRFPLARPGRMAVHAEMALFEAANAWREIPLNAVGPWVTNASPPQNCESNSAKRAEG
eukprot:1207370-Rhodomonas_salina.3